VFAVAIGCLGSGSDSIYDISLKWKAIVKGRRCCRLI